MSIIISKNGSDAKKIDRSDFEKEDELQNYIHKNPESIPVYEIQEDKKLFVVAREFPTESGPIDALAVDKNGDIYIVETKLYKNPDKRTVVAQALDYGASLWKHFNDFAEFMNLINQRVETAFQMSFSEKAKIFFEIDEEQFQILFDTMRTNLRDGNIKFVILMDSMDERLKDLILYVNQNSQFDIYAVQLEYYKFEKYEIMIPKLFGVEVKKNVGGSGGVRKKWTKEEFLKNAKNVIADAKAFNILSDLLSFTERNADVLDFGTGASGSFQFKIRNARAKTGVVSVFIVYPDNVGTSIQLTFGSVVNLGPEPTETYYQKLSAFPFMKKYEKSKLLGGYSPGIMLSEAFPDKESLEKFKKAVLEFVKEVRE